MIFNIFDTRPTGFECAQPDWLKEAVRKVELEKADNKKKIEEIELLLEQLKKDLRI